MKKVHRAVIKARAKAIAQNAPVETGFAMRNTIGSIKQYACDNDMRKLLARHKNTADTYHQDLHQFFVLDSSFSYESTDFNMYYATPSMMLTALRVVISEWPLNIFVDLTHCICAKFVLTKSG